VCSIQNVPVGGWSGGGEGVKVCARAQCIHKVVALCSVGDQLPKYGQ